MHFFICLSFVYTTISIASFVASQIGESNNQNQIANLITNKASHAVQESLELYVSYMKHLEI